MAVAPATSEEPPSRHAAIELALTGEQIRTVADGSGVQLGVLRYTRAEAAGVALLAAAVEAGHSTPATERLIRLQLTTEQAELVQDRLGGARPSLWLVDADHTRISYGETWAADEPAPLGRRGVVVPAGAPDPHPGPLLVRLPPIDEGTVVFGTGRHTATRLAATLLEEVVAPGDEVVDVGTGSGVLAVFAVRLGATHVRAVDISPAAIDVARATLDQNGCADRVELVLGELEPGPLADVVVANILAGVLLDLLPTLAATVRPGGHLITSGVVDARADDVVAAAAEHGFLHLRSSSEGGWTAAIFRRR